jgi:hypothetical protein
MIVDERGDAWLASGEVFCGPYQFDATVMQDTMTHFESVSSACRSIPRRSL